MATPTEHAQEQLSRAYVRAVAAKARVKYEWNDEDYGIDGEFQLIGENPGGGVFPNGRPVEFQLKASTNCHDQGQEVAYDLDVEVYNNLLEYEDIVGCVCLLVYDMPDDETAWLDCTADELILRTCCYYWIPSGTPSNNSQTKRIKMATDDTLTPASLPSLVQHLTP